LGNPLREMTGRIRRSRSASRFGLESYPLSPSRASGRRRGRPGRPATDGMPSTRARVWVTSLTLAAVVMTLSGVPRPSQIKWCLLPVFRRSTGDGPVSAPPFSPGCGSRPRTPVTSRVRRPRSFPRAGLGAVGRRLLPSATGPGDASRSGRSRTPAPRAGVARLCRCGERTGRLGGTAGPTPAAALVTAQATAAAMARSAPTSRRPRSTAEYSHRHERPNPHTGHGQPARFTKIVLRARRQACCHPRGRCRSLWPGSRAVSPPRLHLVRCAGRGDVVGRCARVSTS